MIKIAKASTAAIIGCKASAETKLIVASKSMNNKLDYKAALSTLSMSEYRGIDKILNGMYRKIIKDMVTFPTALLYTEMKLGGLGIKRLSTLTQMAKLRMMLRSLHSGGHQKITAESLKARTGCMTGKDFTLGWANCIDKAPDGKSRAWLTSLVEYLKEGDLYILRHGSIMSLWDVPMHRALELDDKQCRMLWARGVRVIGYLVRTTTNGSSLKLRRNLNKLSLLQMLLPKDPPIGAITIHRGMCCRLSTSFNEFNSGNVVDVLGWRHRQEGWGLNVQRWRGNQM